jgi:hypothetical protein
VSAWATYGSPERKSSLPRIGPISRGADCELSRYLSVAMSVLRGAAIGDASDRAKVAAAVMAPVIDTIRRLLPEITSR